MLSCVQQATLTFNGAQFHEPIAILKAVSAGKSAIAPATAAAEAQVSVLMAEFRAFRGTLRLKYIATLVHFGCDWCNFMFIRIA